MINEIASNNKAAGDWVELYNHSEEAVQLSGWMLTDSKNNFMFPNILIPSKGYLIICEDVDAFLKAYPDAYRYVGNLGFGLSKRKERIGLFSAEGGHFKNSRFARTARALVLEMLATLPS